MTIDTWASLAALLAVLLTLGGLILTQGRSLRSEFKGDIGRLEGTIAGLDTKIDGVRDQLREELHGVRDELRSDIGRLDDRVYALAVGLRPQVEEAQSRPASGQ